MRWTRAAGRGLLAVALISTSYAGCTATRAQPQPDTSRGPVTLVTGGDLTKYLNGVLEGWNRAHPKEKATLIELPEAADEVRAQMSTSLRSGSARYDILNIDVAWTSEFAAAGWISSLNADRFPIKTFLPPVVDTATYRGRLYALPYVTNAGLLYYRKDILDREGEKPPRTWAELERLAKTVAPKYGLDGYAGQFLPYEGLTVNAAEAVQSQGGAILADEGKRVTVDSPAARQAIEYLAHGVRDGWISKKLSPIRKRNPEKPSKQADCSSCATGPMYTHWPAERTPKLRASSEWCHCPAHRTTQLESSAARTSRSTQTPVTAPRRLTSWRT